MMEHQFFQRVAVNRLATSSHDRLNMLFFCKVSKEFRNHSSNPTPNKSSVLSEWGWDHQMSTDD